MIDEYFKKQHEDLIRKTEFSRGFWLGFLLAMGIMGLINLYLFITFR